MRSVRIGVLGVTALVSMVIAGCGSSTSGTATAVGASTAKETKSERPGASSPKAAAQALIDAVKGGDQDKIDAVVCENWTSPTNRSGKFSLASELDPPAQKAFPKSTAGE